LNLVDIETRRYGNTCGLLAEIAFRAGLETLLTAHIWPYILKPTDVRKQGLDIRQQD
jgi:hypothetical protein